MAKEVGAVRRFLETVRDAVQAPARAELERFRDMHVALGGRRDDPLYPPDRHYLEERVRAAGYGYDSRELARYFEVTAVRDGLFDLTARLFGLAYRRADDAVLWHPDVEAYDVWSGDRRVGRIVLDLYPRPGKFKHAGTFEVRPAWRAPPIGALVCNFPRPGGERPALLTHDEVVVFFHEFGHLLHEILSEAPFAVFAGEAVARDFVEVPSQFNENWALDPKILPHFAVHYQTGQVIPQALIQKVLAARTFNQGYEVGEALEAARLDLDWHSLPATAPRQDVDKFEADALAKGGFDVADVPPRYRSSYFLHIWSNGYSASYYAYAWTRMLGQDAFATFEKNGGLTRANGQRFRDLVLSRGNTLDYAEMYRNWAGHDPQIQPYLDYYGLNGGNATPAPVTPAAVPAPAPAPATAVSKPERGR
jgi:peptidyl-dipeptidase Dcp